MAILLAIVFAAAALVFVFAKLQGARKELWPEGEEPAPRKSRRQRKLDQIRANDPPHEAKSVFDLMMEEVTDLGLEDVPGGENIDLPVKLKVWKRDAAVRASCSGTIRFVVHTGAAAAAATVDDVRLECVENAAAEDVHAARVGEPTDDSRAAAPERDETTE